MIAVKLLCGQQTGFRVHFGPVYAKDIPAYVNANYKKTDEMRLIKFTMLDRLILTPMEINPAGSTTFTGMSGVRKELKIALPVYLIFTALSVILLITDKLSQWNVI